MSRYVINPLASQDLNEIADCFAKNNLTAGEEFFQAFNRKCKQLVAFPQSGKKYPTIHPDIRGLPLEGYIIFYRVREDGIEILRVINGRRNFFPLFRKLD
ncbi:MAG: type II toxin-antitoxin system RelE/ParE family toxin [Cyanobacteriota bacterium]